MFIEIVDVEDVRPEPITRIVDVPEICSDEEEHLNRCLWANSGWQQDWYGFGFGRPETYQIMGFEKTNKGVTAVQLHRYGSERNLYLPAEQASDLEAGEFLAVPVRYDESGSYKIWEDTKFFGFYKVLVQFQPDLYEPIKVSARIPILRLHSPQRQGTWATYQHTVSTGNTAQASVAIAGIGGGGGKKITYRTTEKWTVKDGESIEVFVPAELILQAGTTLVNGHEVSYGLRATVKELRTAALGQRDLTGSENLSQKDSLERAQFQAIWDYDASKSSAGEYEKRILRGTEFSGKVGINLETPGFPLRLGLDYSYRSTHEAEITTHLVPGAHYYAYAPNRRIDEPSKNHFEICWSVERGSDS